MRLARTTLVGALLLVAPAGCGTSPEASPAFIAETSHPTSPAAQGRGVLTAAGDPRRLVLVTQGSSSCPSLPVSIVWDAAAAELTLVTALDAGPDEACTADSTFTASLVVLPDEAPDLAVGESVVVDGEAFAVERG